MTHHDHGGIIKFKKPSRNMSKKPGQWNQLIVYCEGHYIRVGLNGIEVQNTYLDSEPDEGLPSRRLNSRPMRGHLGLQDHGVPHRIVFQKPQNSRTIDLKVFLIQFSPTWENKESNYSKVQNLIERSSPEPHSLVVLPEAFATGFSLNPKATTKQNRIKPMPSFLIYRSPIKYGFWQG